MENEAMNEVEGRELINEAMNDPRLDNYDWILIAHAVYNGGVYELIEDGEHHDWKDSQATISRLTELGYIRAIKSDRGVACEVIL
jgi:hypothetical protein